MSMCSNSGDSIYTILVSVVRAPTCREPPSTNTLRLQMLWSDTLYISFTNDVHLGPGKVKSFKKINKSLINLKLNVFRKHRE